MAEGIAGKSVHVELTQRIAALSARGGGTLELGDGVYGIDRPLLLPLEVSLCMTPHARVLALPGFEGAAVVIKDAGADGLHKPAGAIRGGVIDGGRQPLTGLRVEQASRLEISELEVRDATYKGIHFAGGWYEANLNHVRCNVDLHTHYAPGSIGIHYEKCGDSLVHSAVVIGYETGVRSDTWSNNFQFVHVWNYDPEQGPMKHCFYCNGTADTYSQCYADSPTLAGFYMLKPFQAVLASRIYYSRWAADRAGAGILIAPEATHGTYVGNFHFADKDHTLAKAYDGNLETACILGDVYRGGVVHGGKECRIPSGVGGANPLPSLRIAGGGLCLTPRSAPPAADEGQLGEMAWVDGENAPGLYIKTSAGWKRAKLE